MTRAQTVAGWDIPHVSALADGREGHTNGVWPSGTAALEQFLSAAVALQTLVAAEFTRQPALLIAVAVMALIPVLAAIGAITDLINRRHRWQVQPAAISTQRATEIGLARPRAAWLNLGGEPKTRIGVPRELLSIGREDDNDVQLDDPSVHRHHAVVRRSEDANFVIKDLSGRDGNGIKVNGERVSETALMDGDCIEVGAVKLTFEARPR
jgi:FHA domain